MLPLFFYLPIVMREKVGIKKIAELSGVSIGTVDRVLNNRKGVSKETAKHIRAVIKHTGYKKNNVASRLKLANNKTITIAVLFPKEAYLDEHYWHLPLKGIHKAVSELSEMGIKHELHVFEIGSAKSFEKESKKILSKKPDALITVPFFIEQCKHLTEESEKMGIPVVFIDTEMDNEINNKYSIHQNSFQSGKVAARILSQIISDKGKYIVLNLVNDSNSQKNNQEREAGFRTFFKNEIQTFTPNIDSFTVYQSESDSLKKIFNPLTKTKEQIGVFVTNSRTYLLPKTIRELNLNNRTTIIGYDLNPTNIELLKKNEIQFIINQQPEYQGYSAVRGLFKLITEEEDSELSHKIPIEIIVKENFE